MLILPRETHYWKSILSSESHGYSARYKQLAKGFLKSTSITQNEKSQTKTWLIGRKNYLLLVYTIHQVMYWITIFIAHIIHFILYTTTHFLPMFFLLQDDLLLICYKFILVHIIYMCSWKYCSVLLLQEREENTALKEFWANSLD